MFVVVVDVRRESGEEIRFREIANGWVDSPLCMQYICVCVVLWQRRMAQMVFRARLPATTMRLNIAAVMMAAVLYKHTYIELNGNGQHRDNIKHSADRSIFFSLSGLPCLCVFVCMHMRGYRCASIETWLDITVRHLEQRVTERKRKGNLIWSVNGRRSDVEWKFRLIFITRVYLRKFD